MNNVAKKFLGRYFGHSLGLRVRLFNVLAIGGTVVSLLMAVLGVVNNGGVFNVIVNFIVAAMSFSLLTYSRKSGRYQICYMVSIIGIFICFFPALFFSSGGYHGGMASFFVFAVVFTMFMLEGKKAIIFSATELAFYIAVCIIAYQYPEIVNSFETEQAMLINIIIAFTVISVALGATMYAQVSLYRAQQQRLDAQNAVLSQANRAKTQFLANASHEMRTPLTVISVNVQVVLRLLKRMDDSVKEPETETLLKNAQNEIMRLSRMVDGMLTLTSISDGADKRKTDISSLLQSAADMLRIHLQERGNILETKIDGGLVVFADADLISQVIVNLIQNARQHTENGCVLLTAALDGGAVKVTVGDNGSGISPEMLPYVFERGVSDGGGKGLGLDFCKTVVESHGGTIWVESEPGRGTAVSFTVPYYEGQFGGDRS